MNFSSIKSWAGRGLNGYITKSLKIYKSLSNSLNIKKNTIFEKQIYLISQRYYQKILYSYEKGRKS